jgi:hypothetical protein
MATTISKSCFAKESPHAECKNLIRVSRKETAEAYYGTAAFMRMQSCCQEEGRRS